MMKYLLIGFVVGGVVYCAGCQSTYYKTMEKFGYHKREILVDRVQDARQAQEEAKEQFQSALEQFSAVMDFQGGELETKYSKLKGELEDSEDKAKAVSKRIGKVEDVSAALFEEWQEELEEYSDERLRAASETRLKQTEQRYAQYIGAMKRAESKIDPVLTVFRDQVLFLKHNLNAQAIASLQDEMITVEADIAGLIREMEASIAEADAFIQVMATD